MQAMLKQAQRLQKDMGDLEKEIATRDYESTMGGGVVKVCIKGNMSIENISIDESLLTKDGKEDLEEMLKAAINEALRKAVEDKETSMNAITGGVKMPGGF